MLTQIPIARSGIWRGLPSIFQAIADADNGRFMLSEPWIYRDHIYASDGRITVRIGIADRLDDPPYPLSSLIARDGTFLEKIAKVAAAMFDHTWSDTPTPIPPAEPPRLAACPSCRGDGCDSCDHDGGFFIWVDRVNVAPGLDLGSDYLSLLHAHGVTSVYRAVDPLIAQVFFRIGGIEGVLMPLVPRDGQAEVRPPNYKGEPR